MLRHRRNSSGGTQEQSETVRNSSRFLQSLRGDTLRKRIESLGSEGSFAQLDTEEGLHLAEGPDAGTSGGPCTRTEGGSHRAADGGPTHSADSLEDVPAPSREANKIMNAGGSTFPHSADRLEDIPAPSGIAEKIRNTGGSTCQLSSMLLRCLIISG